MILMSIIVTTGMPIFLPPPQQKPVPPMENYVTCEEKITW